MLEITVVQLFLLVTCGSDEAPIAVLLNEVFDDDAAVYITVDVSMAYSKGVYVRCYLSAIVKSPSVITGLLPRLGDDELQHKYGLRILVALDSRDGSA